MNSASMAFFTCQSPRGYIFSAAVEWIFVAGEFMGWGNT